ncbi:hypothetical protein QBC39DRAFT_417090 [Podospora conica]|nr:hypothetical protein QBC39DRAFT_417090 [Schizothecium conicum]
MSSPSTATASPGCSITGNPEIYGLGIRVSFYLLWFSLTLSRWIPSPELFLVVLGTHFVFAMAVFFGLVITAANARTLSAAEVYVTIMLISALACYERVPYCLWRMATAFRRELDNRVYYFHHGLVGREDMAGPNIFVVTETSLLGCVVGLQLWFFISGVESGALYDTGTTPGGGRCVLREQSGFLFTASDLRSAGFRAVNIIIILVVVVGSIIVSLADRGLILPQNRRRKRKQKLTHLRLCLFKQMQTLIDLTVTPILIGAIEATLLWNRIPNANHATTTSQLIPLFLSITLLVFVLCQLLITLGESIRLPSYNSPSYSSSNTIEHIYSAIPRSPCTCGGPGCPTSSDGEKYSYPTTTSPSLSHPAATAARYPRRTQRIPPAPTVVSTSESSSSSSSSSDTSARTDKADSGASSSPPSLKGGGSPKKSSVDGDGKGGSGPPSPTKGGSSSGSGGGPKGPRPISGQGSSS